MPETTNPIIKTISACVATGAVVASVAVWIMRIGYVVPLERDNASLTAKLDNASTQIKSSKEYRELEAQAIEYKTEAQFLKSKSEDYNVLMGIASDFKAENAKLEKLVADYEDAIMSGNETSKSLEARSSIIAQINELQKKQSRVEDRLKYELANGRTSFAGGESEIKRLQNRIAMLQEQINILAKSLQS